MCQLTFAHFRDEKLNALYTIIQALENTRATHRDGFGLFDGESIHKWERTPSMILNFHDLINFSIATNLPVISHVRRATLTNGKSIVSKEKSHPFETEDLILAHNGSLELKDENEMKSEEYEDLIDSEIFLKELQKEYSNKATLFPALRDTMEKFAGKFAFLIYSKKERRYYVVKGRTADLYISKVMQVKEHESDPEKILGLVINTEKDNLIKGLTMFAHLAKFVNSDIYIDFTDPEKLKSETMYSVNTKKFSLRELGVVKESTKVIGKPSNYSSRGRHYDPVSDTWRDLDNFSPFTNLASVSDLNMFDSLLKDCRDLGVSIHELDEIFYHSIGIPLLYLTEDDLEIMSEWVLPILYGMKTDEKEKIWRIVHGGMTKKYENLQFPYMLNEEKDLIKGLEDLLKGTEYDINA